MQRRRAYERRTRAMQAGASTGQGERECYADTPRWFLRWVGSVGLAQGMRGSLTVCGADFTPWDW
jgi:hypothetical protein